MTVVDVFEGVGQIQRRRPMSNEAYLTEALERSGVPFGRFSCGGQFTANTMACVSEALGLALPGSAGRAGTCTNHAMPTRYASGDGRYAN